MWQFIVVNFGYAVPALCYVAIGVLALNALMRCIYRALYGRWPSGHWQLPEQR